MRGALWNIRGLNKVDRSKYLSDFIKDNNLDFMGIHETKKVDLSCGFMNAINKDMARRFLPANGTAGGILVGCKNSCFDIVICSEGKYNISIMVKNNNDKLMWRLIVVYGSPYDKSKLKFLEDLQTIMEN
jgi:hypothetical protein